jgi:hypothetical protein
MNKTDGVSTWTVLVLVAVALAAWQAAFLATGIGRGDAQTSRVAPPPPVGLPPVDTSWVDLETYLRNHPVWQP